MLCRYQKYYFNLNFNLIIINSTKFKPEIVKWQINLSMADSDLAVNNRNIMQPTATYVTITHNL